MEDEEECMMVRRGVDDVDGEERMTLMGRRRGVGVEERRGVDVDGEKSSI